MPFSEPGRLLCVQYADELRFVSVRRFKRDEKPEIIRFWSCEDHILEYIDGSIVRGEVKSWYDQFLKDTLRHGNKRFGKAHAQRGPDPAIFGQDFDFEIDVGEMLEDAAVRRPARPRSTQSPRRPPGPGFPGPARGREAASRKFASFGPPLYTFRPTSTAMGPSLQAIRASKPADSSAASSSSIGK